MSARLPFIATHNGSSVLCCLVVNKRGEVLQLEEIQPHGDSDGARSLFVTMRERIEFMNDLMQKGMSFEMLATCRRHPGVYGAILDPAATEYENFRTAIQPPGGANAA